jgi:hypothetical protein
MQGLLKSGKIYKLLYSNSKSDAQPLLLVLELDSKYLEGLNINYLTPYEMKQLAGSIVRMNVNFASTGFSGMLIYKMLLAEMPDAVKRCYRKYFTKYVSNAYLVSNGISDADASSSGEKVLRYSNSFIKYLNKLLSPKYKNVVAGKQSKNTEKITKVVGTKRFYGS